MTKREHRVRNVAGLRLEAAGEMDWWFRPRWNRTKDRPSVLDVERLRRRHRPEILHLLLELLEPALNRDFGAHGRSEVLFAHPAGRRPPSGRRPTPGPSERYVDRRPCPPRNESEINIMARTTLLERVRSDFTGRRGGRDGCPKGSAVVKRRRSLQVRLEALEERMLLDSSNQLSLTQIATGYQTSGFSPPNGVGSIQVVNTVFNARSFTNHQDLYYVQQEVDFTNFASADQGTWSAAVTNFPPNSPPGVNPLTLQPGPQSNPGTTTVSSSVSKTISGSIGWNESQGFNASIGFSVTIANTTSATVPPIAITYLGNPVTGSTQWEYSQPGPLQNGQTTTLYEEWIWAIPFAQEHNIADLGFQTQASLAYNSSSIPQVVEADLSTVVPLPFGSTFTLTKPKVTGVSPKTVQPGDLFTIEGTGLYPSLIQGVFIGGQPVNMANVVPVSDTAIEILAPNTPSTRPQSVVVRTNQGFSNNKVKIIISPFSASSKPSSASQTRANASRTRPEMLNPAVMLRLKPSGRAREATSAVTAAARPAR
jgi:hypothetical protein